MHVVAFLPRNLLNHLRVVLGDIHSLGVAAGTAELHTLLRTGEVDLLIVDPTLGHADQGEAIGTLIAQQPSLPVILYTTLSPAAMRQVITLGRAGVQHVVLNRFDDEPRRFLELIERVPAQPLAELMLQELAAPLAALPVVVARAIEQLFRSPARVKNTQELAQMAGMIPRTLYRHLTPVGLAPRQLIICARLLRAYTLLAGPERRLKEVAQRLGYVDPGVLSAQLRDWTGLAARDVGRTMTPEQFVHVLADHLRRAELETEDSAV